MTMVVFDCFEGEPCQSNPSSVPHGMTLVVYDCFEGEPCQSNPRSVLHGMTLVVYDCFANTIAAPCYFLATTMDLVECSLI